MNNGNLGGTRVKIQVNIEAVNKEKHLRADTIQLVGNRVCCHVDPGDGEQALQAPLVSGL